MIRLVITAVLFISVFVMMQAISSTWRQQMQTVPLQAERKEAPVEVAATPDLQPAVPSVLPDLKSGYLFNEERLIENETAKVLDDEGVLVNDLGIDASIEELTYSGSIIGDTFSRAIISYPEKKQQRGSTRGRGKSAASGTATAQLTEGDMLNGYKVTSILADKIVFSKGGDVLEKFLYDPSKNRVTPTRQVKTPARGGASALAPPSPVGAAPTGSAAPPPMPTAAVTERGAAPAPARRVVTPQPAASRRVISRRPPPQPDTSRVSRRRRSSGPASTPPMPHLGN